MKTYNKSAIMKLAHFLRRNEGLTMSVALKLAWGKARRNEFYWIMPAKVKRVHRERVITSAMANAISSYYVSNAYNGD